MPRPRPQALTPERVRCCGSDRPWVLGPLAALALACGASPPAAPEPLALEAGATPGRLAGAVTWPGGARLHAITLPAAPVVPGAEVTVTWRAEGAEGLTLEVGLVPPRLAARQEVRYGAAAVGTRELPDEPPRDDPRARWIRVPAVAQAATLRLPDVYFPRQAVLLARGRRGADPVPAVAGPRREDGTVVLGVLDVAPTPRRVRVPRTPVAPTLDGVLDDAAWRGPALTLVESLHGEPAGGAPTRVWLAWDARALYVAADVPDSDVWGTLSARDDKLWEQEVFEVFLAADGSGRDYLELQVSPRGTRFDARFSRHRQGDIAWDGVWEAAVQVDGTLDVRTDRDRGWRVELAVPWDVLCGETRIECPVVPGRVLRGNVFRIERPRGAGTVALALSPTRRPDFHTWASAAVLELAP